MRTNIALSCVVAGVLLSCSKETEAKETEAKASITSSGRSLVMSTNHADTWTALESILKDSSFEVKVTVFGATVDEDLPAEIVATHKDGTKMDIKLAQDSGGGTKISFIEDTSKITVKPEDILKVLKWPKVLERLKTRTGWRAAKDVKTVDAKDLDVKKVAEESRAVIDLIFMNLSSSDAEEIRKRLEKVDNVEKVKVDLDSTMTTVKCLIKEWTASSDVGTTVKLLKDALGESYPVTGFGSQIHSSREWSTLKLKLGW